MTLDELVEESREHACAGVGARKLCVRPVAVADLPSRFGSFRIVGFQGTDESQPAEDKEHIALVHGDVIGASQVVTRLHSECLTGDVLGSLRCDCRDQLEEAMLLVAQRERGIVLYLRQEGRGIGLVNKIRAYALQDRGLDTVDANLALGFRDDERDYAIAAHMLQSLRVQSIQLLTNNPGKVSQLEAYGVKVAGRLPHVLPPNPHNRFYLETKATRFGHYIDFTGKPHLSEQSDAVRVAGMPDDEET